MSKGLRLGGRGVICIVALAAFMLQGCSQAPTVTDSKNASVLARSASEERAHQTALQHFIDGSVHELKGEFAEAVLEFQDALRLEKDQGIYYALSKNYSYLGKHSLAIEAGKEAVRLAPEKLEYRRNLAEVYAGAFEFDAAAGQYEEILRRDSSAIDVWYALARLYQAQKPLKALEVYEHITARFGPDWEILLQVAELYSKMGQFEKSADALKQMLDLDPGNQALRRSIAQAYARAGKLDAALKVFAELCELDPSNLEYRADIAGIYLLKKEYARAANEFEPILARDTVSVETKLHIGELYFGQLEKDSTLAPVARSIFQRIRKDYPIDWRAYWFLGAIGTVIHDDTLSVSNFRKVTELASWNTDAWVYLSSVFLDRNNYGEAVRVLESALKVLPDDVRVNFLLGVAYSRLGRNIEAVRVLEHARDLNPKDTLVIPQLAMVYDGLKRYEESDSLYEEALKINPGNDLVLNNYGYSLAERGEQLERALRMTKKALEAKPDNASYLDTMGWIYFRLGMYKEAENFVKKAISKGEANAVVFEHLGDIYYNMNEGEKAMEQWTMALKLDESNKALKDKIARRKP